MWQKEYGNVPDTFEGEQWQACQVLAAGIEKAGSIEAAKLRPALETVTIDSIKGTRRDARMRPSGGAAGLHGARWRRSEAHPNADPGGDRHLSRANAPRRPATSMTYDD